MKCNHCQAELEEGVSVCPNCGEVQSGHAQKPSSAKKGIVIAIAAVLLIACVALIVTLTNQSADPYATDPAETPQTIASVATDATEGDSYELTASDFLMNGDVANRLSYTADADALVAAADTVIATAGEYSLTNSMLQVYYWSELNSFLNEYGAYATYFYGLDSSQPLDSQKISGVDVTWEQYFLDSALAVWNQCALLNTLAKAEGYTLDPDMAQVLDELVTELQADALNNGYADADALVAEAIGPGCTAQGYHDYMVFYWTASAYSMELVGSLQPTDADILAYYEANKADFEASGITEESAPYVDVRHILLTPQGTTDETGATTYSDEAWAACLAEAQALLDTWKAGEATEESFAALANEYSEDSGSNTTGGLYSNVTDDGTYVEAFTSWCVNDAKNPGDTGVVTTEYGCHVMYCSAIRAAWYVNAQNALLNELYSEKLEACEQTCPAEFLLDQIVVGSIAEEAATE